MFLFREELIRVNEVWNDFVTTDEKDTEHIYELIEVEDEEQTDTQVYKLQVEPAITEDKSTEDAQIQYVCQLPFVVCLLKPAYYRISFFC